MINHIHKYTNWRTCGTWVACRAAQPSPSQEKTDASHFQKTATSNYLQHVTCRDSSPPVKKNQSDKGKEAARSLQKLIRPQSEDLQDQTRNKAIFCPERVKKQFRRLQDSSSRGYSHYLQMERTGNSGEPSQERAACQIHSISSRLCGRCVC